MITEKISEYSKRPEFQYCNYCKYFTTDPRRSFHIAEDDIGEGECIFCRAVVEYYRSRCNSFKFDFKPKYQTVSEQEIFDAQHNRSFILEKRRVRRWIMYDKLADSFKYLK